MQQSVSANSIVATCSRVYVVDTHTHTPLQAIMLPYLHGLRISSVGPRAHAAVLYTQKKAKLHDYTGIQLSHS